MGIKPLHAIQEGKVDMSESVAVYIELVSCVTCHDLNESMGAFFRSLTRSDQLCSFPSRFSIVSGTKVSCFLIVPEQPVSIQNRSVSIVRKYSVAGQMSSISQSDVLFTIDGFQASW